MTTNVTSKMTKAEMVNVLIILMDVPANSEETMRTQLMKMSQVALTTMYDVWIRANNKCEVAKREMQYAKEHQQTAERRASSFEREVDKLKKQLKGKK